MPSKPKSKLTNKLTIPVSGDVSTQPPSAMNGVSNKSDCTCTVPINKPDYRDFAFDEFNRIAAKENTRYYYYLNLHMAKLANAVKK